MEESIRSFIESELLGPGFDGPLAADDELLLSELIDSLSVVRLIAFIEDSCAVSIPPTEITIEHFSSVRAIAQFVGGLTRA